MYLIQAIKLLRLVFKQWAYGVIAFKIFECIAVL